MKAFLIRLGTFTGILALIILAITLLVPATPRTRTSLLFSKLDKDRLLENTPPPRLILIGGSNLSMGIDSSVLNEELGITPVNTAIHASIGLEYILENVLEYVQPGDIIIVSLEYTQFFGGYMYGGEELLRTVFDVDRSDLRLLDLYQWISISRFIPKYSISKIKPSEYFFKEPTKIGVYERGAFNQFGDAVIHWDRPQQEFEAYPGITKPYNPRAVDLLVEFDSQVSEAGGRLIITYPAIQDQTYQNMAGQIKRVQNELEKSGLAILGNPEKYIVDDSLLFDTAYHLTREGALIRTNLLVEDLRSIGLLTDD